MIINIMKFRESLSKLCINFITFLILNERILKTTHLRCSWKSFVFSKNITNPIYTEKSIIK
jgi:hypothetical protein